jgi:hypothetical protein
MDDMAERVVGRSTMSVFVIAAAIMAVIHLVAVSQRPHPAVIVAAVLWLLYAVWEYFIATGVLCDANCNIRVDLVLFFPILAIATFYAYRSYMGLPGQPRILGVIGLVVVGLLVAMFLGLEVVAIVGALAIGIYLVRSRSRSSTNRS